MITRFIIKNFKSHAHTDLKLSRINLITGMNGMGKSSVLQALLLLRQTNAKGMLDLGLELLGELCNIGLGKDALYQFAENDIIELKLIEETHESHWQFDAGPRFGQSTLIQRIGDDSGIQYLHNLFARGFQYISAYRNGPASEYNRDTSAVEIFNQVSRREGRGELVAHYLQHFADNIVAEQMRRPAVGNTLKWQVEEWMRAISPGLSISITPRETSYDITYSYERGKGLTKTNDFKAANVGFGISYVLPIVVATLNADDKSLILIENPESHIHPTGQAMLMELIAKAASVGVQFIIETHSDHIINGLLVATKKQLIRPEDSMVHFFERDAAAHSTTHYQMEVLQGGKIKDPPQGFFDQFDKDMKTLVGF